MNHESFANSSSTLDFKSPVILLFDLSNPVSHQDTSLSLIWAPQILWSSFISGGKIARCLPIRCRWFSLSSARRVSLDLWHRAGLSQNCLTPQSLPLSCQFVESSATEPKRLLFHFFYRDLGPSASRLSFTEGDTLQYTISAYQNHISKSTSVSRISLQFYQFCAIALYHGPTVCTLDQGSLLLRSGHNCHCYEDSF